MHMVSKLFSTCGGSNLRPCGPKPDRRWCHLSHRGPDFLCTIKHSENTTGRPRDHTCVARRGLKWKLGHVQLNSVQAKEGGEHTSHRRYLYSGCHQLGPLRVVIWHRMRKLISSLRFALFLAAAVARTLAEPGTIPTSLVRVTKTDAPIELEALIGVAVSTNDDDGGYRSVREPDSSEACVENRLCGPNHICCEGLCTACHFC